MDVKAEDIYVKMTVYFKNKTNKLERKQQEWEY
jgi:hypothetical protein